MSDSRAEQPGRKRYIVYGLLFTMTLINYFDRTVLSVAMPILIAQFTLTPIAVGYLLSAFIWSYAPCQLPAGMVLDQWGTRKTAARCIAFWSAATALTAAATSFPFVFISRLLLGIGESPTFPMAARAIREWAPVKERALAFSISGSGPAFGTAISAITIAWLVSTIGWRLSFVFSGALGFLWVIVWLAVYRDPEDAPFLQPAERRMILAERSPGGTSDTGGMKLKELLSYQTMWGLFLVQGCVNYTQYLFLTWLPTYLVQSRGLNIMHSGLETGICYFGAMVLTIGMGRLCDHLLTPEAVKAGKRRYAVVILAFGASVMVLAPYTPSEAMLLVELTFSLACVQSVFVNTYSLTNDLLHAGKSIGTAIGWIQLGGNIFGLAAPIATGYIVFATGSFTSAFLLAGALLIIGAVITLTMTRRPVGAPQPAPAYAS
ncbi:MFS transporter [Acidisphaera sp. S103]|uniref:MFS transporter n=1 Tax=Acidisphaera sp. S103 TaxID=1747223 RepID=UPI00131DE650|nr:MFS transporter [Acidisphaera sp. S103]